MLFNRDVFGPLDSFGWLGVTLFAAWCIGRPYGVAPLSLTGVAIAMDTGPMVPREAGTPATDTVPVALLLAATAILINAWAMRSGNGERSQQRAAPSWSPLGALLVAGLAMGIALGSKLTISGATAAMAVGVLLIVPPGMRRQAFGVFLGGGVATAGFWFLRNLIHSGNPLPWIHHIGPIQLPGPDRGLEGRDNFTVAHYIFCDPSTERLARLLPQADNEPARAALVPDPRWRRRGRDARHLAPSLPGGAAAGAVAMVAAIAYLFTPLTAAGPEGHPLAFGINLRYLTRGWRSAWRCCRWSRARPGSPPPAADGRGPDRALLHLALLGRQHRLEGPFASIPWAALIGIVLIGAPVGLALLARRRAMLAGLAGAVLALAIGAVGWAKQDDYFAHRYRRAEDFRFQLDDAVRWAKPTSTCASASPAPAAPTTSTASTATRSPTTSSTSAATCRRPTSARIENCPDFRRAVNDGRLRLPDHHARARPEQPVHRQPSPERGWLRAIRP